MPWTLGDAFWVTYTRQNCVLAEHFAIYEKTRVADTPQGRTSPALPYIVTAYTQARLFLLVGSRIRRQGKGQNQKKNKFAKFHSSQCLRSRKGVKMKKK